MLVALAPRDAECARAWTVNASRVGTQLIPGGEVLQTVDGTNWTILDTLQGNNEGDPSLEAVHFFDRDHGWVGGLAGNIWASSDAGTTWSYQLAGNASDQIMDIHFASLTEGWALGGKKPGDILVPVIWYTETGGDSSGVEPGWESQFEDTLSRPQALDVVSSGKAWAIFLHGELLRKQSGQNSWTGPDTISPTKHTNDIDFIDDDEGWVVGTKGLILHSTDGGTSWAEDDSLTNWNLNGVFFLDATRGWAVGEFGTVFYHEDGTWSAGSGIPATVHLYAVVFTDPDTGWAVGHKSVIYRSVDGGANWSAQTSGLDGVFFNVAAVPNLYADLGPDRSVRRDSAVTLDGSNSGPTTEIESYSFDFDGDGSFDYTETEASPGDGFDGITTHTYSTAGIFDAELKVQGGGVSVTDVARITVLDYPDADLGPNAEAPFDTLDGSPFTTDEAVLLDGSGSTADDARGGSLVQYRFDFNGDSTFDYTETPTSGTRGDGQRVWQGHGVDRTPHPRAAKRGGYNSQIRRGCRHRHGGDLYPWYCRRRQLLRRSLRRRCHRQCPLRVCLGRGLQHPQRQRWGTVVRGVRHGAAAGYQRRHPAGGGGR
jgi:photosystem II stability/assembly factor-like uncharacterized protein